MKLQIPPLRYAPVGMTKVGVAIPSGIGSWLKELQCQLDYRRTSATAVRSSLLMMVLPDDSSCRLTRRFLCLLMR